MNKDYSNYELLTKLKEIIDGSEFIHESLLVQAKEMRRDRLEKLLVITYNAVQHEKKMKEGEKDAFRSFLNNFFKKTSSIYDNMTKKRIQKREEQFTLKEKEQAEIILNQLYN